MGWEIPTDLELDRPRLVLVKHVKHVFRKLGRIAKGEELAVDLLELCNDERVIQRWRIQQHISQTIGVCDIE
jgi:hypothetical protein